MTIGLVFDNGVGGAFICYNYFAVILERAHDNQERYVGSSAEG